MKVVIAGIGFSVAVFALTGCGGPPQASEEAPAAIPTVGPASEIRVADVGFATPESVLHDPAADVYLVSNINGSPSAVDGNGFISRVSPDGTVTELKWIDGGVDGVTLDAPKGMAVIGDTLYVADISFVRFFDRATGAPKGDIEIPGATFVNDLAAGRDGWLMVSDTGVVFGDSGAEDTGSAAVYVISPEGALTQIASGERLDRPNGVLGSMAHDAIVVAPFGGDTVYALDNDGQRVDLAALPSGGLDGIVETSDGRLLVTSWGGGAVFSVDMSGDVETFASGLPAPADLGYDGVRDRIMVPLFNDNAVVIMPARSDSASPGSGVR